MQALPVAGVRGVTASGDPADQANNRFEPTPRARMLSPEAIERGSSATC
jgi:hypothetical protein